MSRSQENDSVLLIHESVYVSGMLSRSEEMNTHCIVNALAHAQDVARIHESVVDGRGCDCHSLALKPDAVPDVEKVVVAGSFGFLEAFWTQCKSRAIAVTSHNRCFYIIFECGVDREICSDGCLRCHGRDTEGGKQGK